MPTSAVIAKLRDTLRAIEGDGHRRRETLPFGIGEIDTRLAAGGLRLDALHEIAPATPDLADDACATLLLAGIAARAWGPVLWVVRRRDLFAPGLYQAGLSPERVIYAEARDDAELLALMEEGIRHRGLGAVVGEARRAAMASTRRLQLAAEGGRTIALLMKRHAREGGDPLAVPSAAVTRWRVAAAPSAPLPTRGLAGGIGRARWHLSLVRQRGGDPFDLNVEAVDETGRLALPAALVDRPRRQGRAPHAAAA
ncbi:MULTISPECIES: ImuA family protein [Sphingomonas]|uniref:Protein ImuA n=1 Tax=Sphingomonas lycopersici TaxID=2951807 RepID=A0AA41ZKQ7_9SPHN|nr:protein ImuA [Sphingomonas sp. 66-10]MCW6533093.1 protein ImuA [Sphingomonas lycopersici]MCW6537703.1 protein ImuA [Sphingomonas lycopersici]OJU23456.1 MAG: protein ImuA [Sphingomonas sp. 66-10]